MPISLLGSVLVEAEPRSCRAGSQINYSFAHSCNCKEPASTGFAAFRPSAVHCVGACVVVDVHVQEISVACIANALDEPSMLRSDMHMQVWG